MNLLKKLMFVLLCTGLLSSSIVLAEEEADLLNAGELLERCDKDSIPGAPSTPCMKYVVGLVLAVMQMHQAEQSQPFFCINPQLDPKEEVTDHVITHLRNQSSRSEEAAQTLVLEALVKNYPCTGLGSQT